MALNFTADLEIGYLCAGTKVLKFVVVHRRRRIFPRALHTTHQQIEIIIIMLSLHGSLTHGLTDVCFPADLIQQEPPFVAAIVVRREFEPFVAIQDMFMAGPWPPAPKRKLLTSQFLIF